MASFLRDFLRFHMKHELDFNRRWDETAASYFYLSYLSVVTLMNLHMLLLQHDFILVWFRFFLFWLTWAFFWDSYRCTPGSLPALSVHITAKETKENIYFQTRHHFHSAAWAPSIAELLWSAPCGTGSSVVSALSCKCHLTWLWPTCCSKPPLVFTRLWMGRILPVHKSHRQTSCSGSFFLR